MGMALRHQLGACRLRGMALRHQLGSCRVSRLAYESEYRQPVAPDSWASRFILLFRSAETASRLDS